MSKYIVKNCPSQLTELCFYGVCEYCTDCVMKQIVELCKERTVGFIEEGFIKDNILQLLDIQEVE